MKRKLVIFLAAVMTLTLAACGKGNVPAAESTSEATRAPVEAVVYDNSLIEESITEVGSFRAQDGLEYQYSYHVPRLVGDTAAIREVNQLLDESAGELVRWDLDAIQSGEYYTFKRLDWRSFWQDSLLSLLVEAEDIDGAVSQMAISFDFAEDTQVDTAGLLRRLGVEEETFLSAARRAGVQCFDRQVIGMPDDDLSPSMYFHDCYGDESILARRAATAAAVNPEEDIILLDNGRCLYLAPVRSISAGGPDWALEELELSFDAPKSVNTTVKDNVLTATLENGTVYLSFADTEEAVFYLQGMYMPGYDYAESGRGYEMPCDSLELGPDHRYEVQGLYSNYVGMFLECLGNTYDPYLFLITDRGGLEFVDILNGAHYGVFCAMPTPLCVAGAEDGAVFREGDTLCALGADGEKIDLTAYLEAAGTALPEGGWTAALNETSTADLAFPQGSETVSLSLFESGREIASYSAWLLPLGMTEDGIVCGYTFFSDADDCAPIGGSLAYYFDCELSEDSFLSTLEVTVVSGLSPYGLDGTRVTYYRGGDPEIAGTEPFRAVFAGEWMDSFSGRCYLSIGETDTPNRYAVRISWADSASDVFEWTMTGEFDPNGSEAALYYDDCVSKYVSYGTNGPEVETVRYSNGTGSLVMSAPDELRWSDNVENRGADCVFIPNEASG